MELILEIFGDRNISICRELTKKFEEVLTFKVSAAIKNLSSRDNIKGEIVIIVEGGVRKDKPQNLEAILGDALKSMSLSDAANMCALHSHPLKCARCRCARDNSTHVTAYNRTQTPSQ